MALWPTLYCPVHLFTEPLLTKYLLGAGSTTGAVTAVARTANRNPHLLRAGGQKERIICKVVSAREERGTERRRERRVGGGRQTEGARELRTA